MNLPSFDTWIGGSRELAPVPGRDVVDPSTGAVIATAHASSVRQVDAAIAAAAAAHHRGTWRGLGSHGRAEALRAVAAHVESRQEEIGRLDAMCSGVPIAVMALIASSLASTFRDAADLLLEAGDELALPGEREVRLRRVPWGPAAILLPWNVPAGTAAKKIALALAAGAPVVVKPSSVAPWGPQLLVEAIAEAGLPDGVVSLVHGGADIGMQLVSDDRIAAIAMTGGTSTGRAVAAAAAPRFARLQLELGSSNPAIVLDDADLDDAVPRIAAGALKLSGQWCESPERIFVPAGVRDEVVERLVDAFAAPRIGAALDPDTELGPVSSSRRRDELAAQVDARVAAGGRAIAGPQIPDEGSYFAPTVVVCDEPYEAEEFFGPVVVVRDYDDLDAAVAEANSGQTGLGGYVFGADEVRAAAVGARIVAGEVKVNGTSVLDMAPGSTQSFFGASGIGGHGDAGVLEFFRGVQVLGVDNPGAPL